MEIKTIATEIGYKNFGKCIRFERGGVVALVTVDIGPRIIYYGTETVNLLNEDVERNVSKGGTYFDENFAIGEKWYLYGGHRVWKSPEDLESYTTDNYAVEYTLRANGGTFTTRVAKKLDFSIDIEMSDCGEIVIKNIITNKADTVRELSVWSLTVMARGGMLVVPLNDAHDEFSPCQNLVQWPYNDVPDERVFFGKKYLAVAQTNKENALKLGLFSEKGKAYYVLGDKALAFDYCQNIAPFGEISEKQNANCDENCETQIANCTCPSGNFDNKNCTPNANCSYEKGDFEANKKTEFADYPRKNMVYGDFWCNLEAYTNAHILEVESLSPRYILSKGQSATLAERWSIVRNAELRKINDIELSQFEDSVNALQDLPTTVKC